MLSRTRCTLLLAVALAVSVVLGAACGNPEVVTPLPNGGAGAGGDGGPWGDADATSFELIVRSRNGAVRGAIEGLPGATVVAQPNGELLTLTLPEQKLVDEAVDRIRRHGGSIERITPRQTSLEERFLYHVGN